jgi:hypothetical protein
MHYYFGNGAGAGAAAPPASAPALHTAPPNGA